MTTDSSPVDPVAECGCVAVSTPTAVVRLSWAACTHTGNRRSLNEDSLCVAPPVFLIADGMGGHQSGEVASALAAGAMKSLLSSDGVDPVVLEDAVRDTNRLIRSKSAGGSRPMGTTLTGMAVANARVPMAAVVNVGDSRTYLFQGGVLSQITTDHSHVQELIDHGLLTPEDARRHPDRNVVTRALGVDVDVELDLLLLPLSPGQRWIACSDGLSSELEHAEFQVLASGATSEHVVIDLLAAVLAGAARDNVSALVVDVVSVEPTDDVADPRWHDDITQPNRRVVGRQLDRDLPADTVVDDVPGVTGRASASVPASAAPDLPGVSELIDSVPSPWPPPPAVPAAKEA